MTRWRAEAGAFACVIIVRATNTREFMRADPERRFAGKLLTWFDRHGRKNLPWQRDPTPYRVWISEVMLQQTQVTAAIPYFERFVERFPDVLALASAPLDEVLHLWTGLGYYARARHLHAAARAIVERHAGVFPETLAAVEALPGVGRSTAGAILALACGERQPILDGNVKRVLARVFAIGGDPGSAGVVQTLWSKADACTPRARVGDYTQAIMDLGATVCTHGRPACASCPVLELCIARREGRIDELPGRKRRRSRPSRQTTLLFAEALRKGEPAILLERRPARGVWGGLWSPPEFESTEDAWAWCRRELTGSRHGDAKLAPVDHGFTHFDLRLNSVHVRCRGEARIQDRDDRVWYSLRTPPKVGLAQPIRRLLAELAAIRGVSR